MLRELRRLPPKQAATIVLRHLHGYSNREIASVLGVPESTIATRLAAAKKTLRARLVTEAQRISDTFGSARVLLANDHEWRRRIGPRQPAREGAPPTGGQPQRAQLAGVRVRVSRCLLARRSKDLPIIHNRPGLPKAAIALAVAVLAIGGASAGAAAATGSLNPVVWGKTVISAAATCKDQLKDGAHGIGHCVSQVAKQKGAEERAAHSQGNPGQDHPTDAPTSHPTGPPASHPTGPPTPTRRVPHPAPARRPHPAPEGRPHPEPARTARPWVVSRRAGADIGQGRARAGRNRKTPDGQVSPTLGHAVSLTS